MELARNLDEWKDPTERLDDLLRGEHDYSTNSEAYPQVYGLCRRLGMGAEATAKLLVGTPLAEHHEPGRNILGHRIPGRQRNRDFAWFLRDIERCECKFPYLFENPAVKPSAVRRLLDAGDLDKFFTGRSALSDRRVFDAILSSRERDEPCQANRHLKKLTGLPSQTVQDSVQRLIDRGLIFQISPGLPSATKAIRRSAVYGLALPEDAWEKIRAARKVVQEYDTQYISEVSASEPTALVEDPSDLSLLAQDVMRQLKELDPSLIDLRPDSIRKKDEEAQRQRNMVDWDADDTWETVCPKCGGEAGFAFRGQIYYCKGECQANCKADRKADRDAGRKSNRKNVVWGSPQGWHEVHWRCGPSRISRMRSDTYRISYSLDRCAP